MDKRQTSYTPNVLYIYMLFRLLKDRPSIKNIDHIIRKRHLQWVELIDKLDPFELLIKSQEVRSKTIIPVKCSSDVLIDIKEKCQSKGINLGNGYGPFKDNTFRIANFPSIKPGHIEKLGQLMLKNYSD